MPPSPKALTCEGRHPSRVGSGEGDGEGAGAGSNLMTDSTILEMLSSLRALKRSASAERPDTAYGASSDEPVNRAYPYGGSLRRGNSEVGLSASSTASTFSASSSFCASPVSSPDASPEPADKGPRCSRAAAGPPDAPPGAGPGGAGSASGGACVAGQLVVPPAVLQSFSHAGEASPAGAGGAGFSSSGATGEPEAGAPVLADPEPALGLASGGLAAMPLTPPPSQAPYPTSDMKAELKAKVLDLGEGHHAGKLVLDGHGFEASAGKRAFGAATMASDGEFSKRRRLSLLADAALMDLP